MYTNCPECGTVFRISTNELRLAEGYVRCGHCSATFNALASLSDAAPPTVTLQQLTLPVAPEPAAPVSDDTLEFDIPEDSWTNFFEAPAPAPVPPPPPEPESPVALTLGSATPIEPPPREPVQYFSDDGPLPDDAEPEQAGADVGAGLGSDTVDQAGLYRALATEAGSGQDDDAEWQALLAEVQDEGLAPEPVYVIGDDDSPAAPPVEAPEPESPEAESPEAAAPELEVPELEMPLPETAWDEPVQAARQAPRPLPADFAPDLAAAGTGGPAWSARPGSPVADRPFIWEPPAPPPVESGRHWGYTAASVLAGLLLAVQLVHQQRDRLATHPSLMEPMQRIYAALGLPLWPAWDLRAYELRSSEAVADRSSTGALDILARVVVVGDERVGLPLVRVTLRDRFGKPLGTRVFEPGEYLGQNPRPREPVNPGTLIPVEISLKDPGRDAQGFDVDVCLMSSRDGITCRDGREPFAR